MCVLYVCVCVRMCVCVCVCLTYHLILLHPSYMTPELFPVVDFALVREVVVVVIVIVVVVVVVVVVDVVAGAVIDVLFVILM